MVHESRIWRLLWAIPVLVILTGSTLFCGGGDFEEVTPNEAYKILGENQKAVIVDVRSQGEYAFVGHPTNAHNLPLMFWDPETYSFKPNPDFEKALGASFTRDTPVLFMCRSGGRSAKAAQAAISLGFTEVYNILGGFEGENDSEGHRTVDGWKNSNLPYTYKVEDNLKFQPAK